MSDETLKQPRETLWQRAIQWKEALTLVLLIVGIIGGFVWEVKTQQISTGTEVKQLRKDLDSAKLPEEHDRLVRMEQDGVWTRKALERIEKRLEGRP